MRSMWLHYLLFCVTVAACFGGGGPCVAGSCGCRRNGRWCLQDVSSPFWNFIFITFGPCCHSSRHRAYCGEQVEMGYVTTWGTGHLRPILYSHRTLPSPSDCLWEGLFCPLSLTVLYKIITECFFFFSNTRHLNWSDVLLPYLLVVCS